MNLEIRPNFGGYENPTRRNDRALDYGNGVIGPSDFDTKVANGEIILEKFKIVNDISLSGALHASKTAINFVVFATSVGWIAGTDNFKEFVASNPDRILLASYLANYGTFLTESLINFCLLENKRIRKSPSLWATSAHKIVEKKWPGNTAIKGIVTMGAGMAPAVIFRETALNPSVSMVLEGPSIAAGNFTAAALNIVWSSAELGALTIWGKRKEKKAAKFALRIPSIPSAVRAVASALLFSSTRLPK